MKFNALTDKVRAVGYVRVSTEEQAKEGYSLANQERDIQRHCEYMGWELVDIYRDEGISAKDIESRPGLLTALNRLTSENENITYIITWKLSRLSRRMIDVVDIARYLDENNKYLLTLKDSIDTSNPSGKHFLYFAGIFAEFERDTMILQVKGGMEQKAREGEWQGGKPPIGYDLENKKLVTNESECKLVEQVFSMYLAGNGYLTIADKLNEQGYKTKLNKPFSVTAVKNILTNPIYTGIVRWGLRKDWDKKYMNPKTGIKERRFVINDDYIEVNGKHQPIISNEIYNQVQDLIRNNPRAKMRRFQGYHLLSGLLRCPHCGHGMSIQRTVSRGKEYTYYICNQYQNKKICSAEGIKQEDIEDEFNAIFDRIVNDAEFRDHIALSSSNVKVQIEAYENKVLTSQNQISTLKRKENSLIEELLLCEIDSQKETFRNHLKKVAEQIETIEAAIQKDRKSIQDLKEQTLDIGDILNVLGNMSTVIKALDKEQQQILVRKLIKQIHIKDKKISKIEFAYGDTLSLESDKKVLGLSELERTVSQVTGCQLITYLWKCFKIYSILEVSNV